MRCRIGPARPELCYNLAVNDQDQDISGWLSQHEAARAYGVAVRTIRRRIQRGELAARQIIGEHGPEWRIPPPAGYTRPYTLPGETPPDMSPDTADTAAIIAHLLAENARLTSILADQAATIRQLTSSAPALAPPADTPPALPPGPGQQRRPWWRFWQR